MFIVPDINHSGKPSVVKQVIPKINYKFYCIPNIWYARDCYERYLGKNSYFLDSKICFNPESYKELLPYIKYVNYRVDTIKIWLKMPLTKGQLQELRETCLRREDGKEVMFWSPENPQPDWPKHLLKKYGFCRPKHREFRWRVDIQAPTRRTFELLDKFVGYREKLLYIAVVHLCADLITNTAQEAQELQFYVDAHLWKKYSRDYSWNVEDTHYVTRGEGKSQISTYSDKLDKEYGEPCCHIEYRSARPQKDLKITALFDVIEFKHVEFWLNQEFYTFTGRSIEKLGRIVLGVKNGRVTDRLQEEIRRCGIKELRKAKLELERCELEVTVQNICRRVKKKFKIDLKPTLEKLNVQEFFLCSDKTRCKVVKFDGLGYNEFSVEDVDHVFNVVMLELDTT